jgi:F0F1-type ATP synthase assembly protein I
MAGIGSPKAYKRRVENGFRERPRFGWWMAGLGALLVFLIFSLIKMGPYLAHGRFWAEEGRDFLPAIKNTPWHQGLFFIFNGHLELVTNFVVFLASLVEFKHAPLVTTYASYLFQAIPVCVVVFFRDRLGLKLIPLLLFLVILVGLPQSPEVWANSILLHFHFAFLAAVIAAIPIEEEKSYPKWLFRFLLLLSGSSGVPANFLVPIFALLIFTDKKKERWVQTGILAATSLCQITLMVLHPSFVARRSVSVEPLLIGLSMLAQQLVSPAVAASFDDNAKASFLAGALHGKAVPVLLACACCLPVVAFVAYVKRHKDKRVLTLLLSMALVAALSVTLALDDRSGIISAWHGGRYFFVPNCLLFLSLAILLSRSPLFATPDLRANLNQVFARASKHIGLLVMGAFVGFVFFMSLGRVPLCLTGVPWPEAYQKAIREHSQTIPIWPENGNWTVPNYDLTQSDGAGKGP